MQKTDFTVDLTWWGLLRLTYIAVYKLLVSLWLSKQFDTISGLPRIVICYIATHCMSCRMAIKTHATHLGSL